MKFDLNDFILMPVGQGHYIFKCRKWKRDKDGDLVSKMYHLNVIDMEVVYTIKTKARGWKTAVRNLASQSAPVFPNL